MPPRYYRLNDALALRHGLLAMRWNVNDLTPTETEALAGGFNRDGYVVVPAMMNPDEVAVVLEVMEHAQRQLVAGNLDTRRHGGEMYTDDRLNGTDEPLHPNYVLDVARLSPEVHAMFHHPPLVDLISTCLGVATPWVFPPEHGREFGVVYQDARPGPTTGYSRIGWHTDRQAYPTSAFFPSVAVTVHLDATSPANGFLRVLPGSHREGTSGMPPAFEKVPGEVGVYCDRGDVMLHHCDLWHAAARATEDPPGGLRRHLRGSWHGGRPPEVGETIEPFNKNAVR